jgi:nicotinamidase-related amidase
MTTEPIWYQFLTSRDKQMWAASGYGARAGFGTRPALVIIDVNYNFTGDRSEPILESIKRWRNSCGEEGWNAIPVIRNLIDAAHRKRLPVVYSTGVKRSDNWDAGGWAWKNKRNAEDVAKNTSNLDGNAIIAELAPQSQDIVIYKHKPSVFFGTPFSSFLTDLGCDSLLVAGTTTSGCVRATVIDAFSYNYRVAVVEDACFDRSQVSHAVSLCDMHAKYADVVRATEALTYIDGLPEGIFKNLPSGKPR